MTAIKEAKSWAGSLPRADFDKLLLLCEERHEHGRINEKARIVKFMKSRSLALVEKSEAQADLKQSLATAIRANELARLALALSKDAEGSLEI